jgi:hypothetical protein
MKTYLIKCIDGAGTFHRYTLQAASHVAIGSSAFERFGDLRLLSVRRVS